MDYITGAKLDQIIELLDTIRLLQEKLIQEHNKEPTSTAQTPPSALQRRIRRKDDD